MTAPDAPLRAVDDDPAIARPRAPRPGRVILAVVAVVLGIGSCQLPKPPLPKLQVGGVSAVAAARAPMVARSGRS